VKRILIVTISAMLVGTLILGISPAMAGQPQDVIEKSAGCFSDSPDDTPAKVMLPYEGEDLYVFSRVREISDNEQNGSNSGSIRFHPNCVGNARNDADPASPDFPFSIELPDALLLTLESRNILYVDNTEEFVIYDLATVQGKEKTKPSNVTRLFKWLGSFFEASIIDTNADGNIDVYVFTLVKYY